jgi:hypothetical protein
MNVKKLTALAGMFGVHVGKPAEPEEDFLYLSADGESVRSVYYSPSKNILRLRRPGFQYIKGDHAVAIAVALRGHYGFNYESGGLTDTIRRLGEQLEKAHIKVSF